MCHFQNRQNQRHFAWLIHSHFKWEPIRQDDFRYIRELSKVATPMQRGNLTSNVFKIQQWIVFYPLKPFVCWSAIFARSVWQLADWFSFVYKMPNLTEGQIAVIENDFKEKGWSAYKIWKEHPSFNVSKTAVTNLVNKIKETGSGKRKPRSGRPLTVSTQANEEECQDLACNWGYLCQVSDDTIIEL